MCVISSLSPQRKKFVVNSLRISYRFSLAQVKDRLARWGWRRLEERCALWWCHHRHLFHFRHIIQRVGKELVKFAV
jgi:hypothetical protein